MASAGADLRLMGVVGAPASAGLNWGFGNPWIFGNPGGHLHLLVYLYLMQSHQDHHLVYDKPGLIWAPSNQYYLAYRLKRYFATDTSCRIHEYYLEETKNTAAR